MDLHFKGPCLTWSKGTLFNDHWNSSLTEASVLHPPKVHSNYRPIFVKIGLNLKRMDGVKPFVSRPRA